MDRSKLIELSLKYNVPSSYYSFQQQGSDTWVLEEANAEWRLYYSERGNRFDQRTYTSEQEACLAMFNEVNRMLLGDHREPMLRT